MADHRSLICITCPMGCKLGVQFDSERARVLGIEGNGCKRAELYVHIEVGAAGENLSLQAVALDLGTCMVGAFGESEISRVAGLPADEVPLLVMTAGRPAD